MTTLSRMSLGLVLSVCGFGALFTGCPCSNTIQVHNDTLVPVTEVYVKYRFEDDWGDNLIAGNILPGETENVGSFLPGRYDVLLVYFGGGEEIPIVIDYQAGDVLRDAEDVALPGKGVDRDGVEILAGD